MGLSGGGWDNSTLAALAAGCTAAGAVVVKTIERLIYSPKDRQDDATEFRKELRDEIRDLRSRVRTMEIEASRWRSGFFKLWNYTILLRNYIRRQEERIDGLSQQAGLPLQSHDPLPSLPVNIVDGELEDLEETK